MNAKEAKKAKESLAVDRRKTGDKTKGGTAFAVTLILNCLNERIRTPAREANALKYERLPECLEHASNPKAFRLRTGPTLRGGTVGFCEKCKKAKEPLKG